MIGMPPRTRKAPGDNPVNSIPADVAPPEDLLLPQEMVDPGILNPHPENPKLHDDEWISASLVKLGLIDTPLVNRGNLTGRPNEILSGHGRVENWMRKFPGRPIQVGWVDVDDVTAREIMLNTNPSKNDPGYNEGKLLALLQGLPDLSTVQYQTDDLETLARIMDATALPGETDPIEEWWDMPGHLDQVDGVTPARKMIVAFASDEDRDKFAAVIGQTFTEKTRAIWFPPRPNLPSSAYRAVGVDTTEAEVVAVETAGADPVAEPDADGFVR